MKKATIWIFSMFLFLSCSTREANSIPKSTGQIIKIVKDGEGVMILIEFKPADMLVRYDAGNTYTRWFEGADTCRVGQVVTLK